MSLSGRYGEPQGPIAILSKEQQEYLDKMARDLGLSPGPVMNAPLEGIERRSKYHREIKPGVFVDVYDVLQAWKVSNPALAHLIKKALCPGERGHKDLQQDLDDIVASAIRARELEGGQ